MLSTCKYWVDGVLRVGGHALRMGTPKGRNRCYDSFMLGQDGGAGDHKSWLYTSLAGGNVPAAEVAAARAVMDARTFRQEYEASFEQYAGCVYYAFSRTGNVKSCPYDPLLPLLVGMDFNINPMSAAVFQERACGALWQVGEIVLPTSNTDEMVAALKERYGRAGFDPSSPDVSHITVYPDPAGAQRRTSAAGRTDIGILQAAGFKVVAMSRHPLVRDRVNVLNGLFCTAAGVRRLFVDASCVASIKCYEQLTYKVGSSEPDKASGLDHLPDAAGYFVYTRFAVKPAQCAQSTHMGR